MGEEGVIDVDEQPRARFSEPRKLLPLVFMVSSIVFIYVVYLLGHCLPLLQLTEDPEHVDAPARKRGLTQTILLHIFTFPLAICYARAVLIAPGTIPEDPKWSWESGDEEKIDSGPSGFKERKQDGRRRHCRHCKKYKPDRCHHCRTCRLCILKMDHHCPWLYNCVGFHNAKYFFLLLLYSALDCHLVMWTMPETVSRLVNNGTPFTETFVVLFAESLAVVLGILLTLFFCFHVCLILLGMTTIEYSEKIDWKKTGGSNCPCLPPMSGDCASPYYRGPLGNIKAMLGDSVLLWLLPVSPPSGNGLDFNSPMGRRKARRVAREFESERGIQCPRLGKSNAQKADSYGALGSAAQLLRTKA
jgi:hypothetical protein